MNDSLDYERMLLLCVGPLCAKPIINSFYSY